TPRASAAHVPRARDAARPPGHEVDLSWSLPIRRPSRRPGHRVPHADLGWFRAERLRLRVAVVRVLGPPADSLPRGRNRPVGYAASGERGPRDACPSAVLLDRGNLHHDSLYRTRDKHRRHVPSDYGGHSVFSLLSY